MSTPTPDSYEAVIADLEVKRDQITAMIDNLKNMRSIISGGGPPSSGGGTKRAPQGEQDISHDTFFGMTIADAARKYLGIVKHTKTTDEIVDAVEAGGLKHASKDFNKTVRSVLGQQEGFVRVNGDWGLTEWYPGMRKDKKTKSVPQSGKPQIKKSAAKPPDSGKTRKEHPRKGEIGAGSIKDKILKYLAGSPGNWSGAHIASMIDADVGSVRAALGELFHKGLIDRPEQGQYQHRPQQGGQ